MFLELAIGITLAGLTVLIIQALPPEIHHKIYAVALIIAASIYVGFSLLSQNTTWIFTETIGVIIFSAIAFLGVKFSPWFLAMGWLIHPAWDLFIDNHNLNLFVPHWYPTICIGYDIAIASYIAWKCIKPKENSRLSDSFPDLLCKYNESKNLTLFSSIVFFILYYRKNSKYYECKLTLY